MKKATMVILCGATVLLLSSNATAVVVFGDGGAALQGMLHSVTVDPVGNSSIDVLTDAMDDADDSYWAVSASGSSIATLVIELAAVQQSGNIFGIFDLGNSFNRIPLFDGSGFFGSKTVTILDDFSVWVNYMPAGNFSSNGFGYYLDTPAGVAWYSDTALNVDGMDHMMAYQGNDSDLLKLGMFPVGLFQANEYILAFEDQRADLPNYDDFVVLVESVTPVPEPTTIVLLGLGGLLLQKRRKMNH
ncbi:MAG: PEP-CTERM sorting domain-containing protein [Phycisphaerae bacterium]|nr:PEP-CTERM sorting domain-containing protein [Phycisphaerae bacterium]